MWPEVIEAMNYARKGPINMGELNNAAGKRIASLIGCEAAMVSGGACSSMTLGTAACITGKNRDFILRIPELSGMKDEVIIQKSHRYPYDHAVRACGVRLIEVETVKDLERAVNKKTAMMHFSYFHDRKGLIKLKEFAALGKKHHIPTLIDGSLSIPPWERLSEFLNFGFDLAAFSGGKALKGPYSAGLLLGRKDLIEAALLNNAPHMNTIGRGMKVSKEEILGMMVGVEVSLKYDYSLGIKRQRKLMKLITDKLESIPIPGVKTEIVFPLNEPEWPKIRVYWDKSVIRLSSAEATKQLREGEPGVELMGGGFDRRTDSEFIISVTSKRYPLYMTVTVKYH